MSSLTIPDRPLDFSLAAREVSQAYRRERRQQPEAVQRQLRLQSATNEQTPFPKEGRRKFSEERPYLPKNKRYPTFSRA